MVVLKNPNVNIFFVFPPSYESLELCDVVL
jgi:hypothetical protein